MRMHLQRPARMPMWIAGISIGLFAAFGIAAIARSIPASYAGIPDGGTPSMKGAAPGGAGDAYVGALQADLAVPRDTASGRNRARCRECGVVESIRQIRPSGGVEAQHAVDDKVAGGAARGKSGSAIAANALPGNGYETTVRFRDGSKTVFNEASPRTWRSGSRVIVIGRANASDN